MPVKKRSITAEDLYRLEILSDTRISPDGSYVIYRLQRVDRKTEKKYANLWVAPTGGGEPRQFTQGNQTDSSPRWSPDGKVIAFLSNRADKEKPSQVYVIPFNGGEARKLTSIDGEIDSLSWSPDGRRLLCTVRKTDADVLEREKDEQKKKLGVVYRRYERLFYKLDGYGYFPQERTHIWVIDARTGKGRQLTDHPVWDEIDPVFSPDGREIAFVSNRLNEPDQNPDAMDLFVMNASGGEPRLVKTPFGPKDLPSFSPDGTWLAYSGQEGEAQGYRNYGLWVVPLDGSKPARNLTQKFDLHASCMVINDVGSPEQMRPTWSNDSKQIYFQAAYHGSSLLKRISIDGRDLQDIVGEGGVVGSYSFDRTQTKLANFFGQMHDPGQVYLRELGSGTTRHLTRVNRELLDTISLPRVEEVWFKNPEGLSLQGWIMYPPRFDPKRKYPSILEIHGGPMTQYGKYFMHEFSYFASNGYVVYFSNPRGGRGYGEAHTKAIWGDWGSADYVDVMAFAELMSRKPYIDKSRMGVTGGSYGGYMTLWIIGHNKFFKAAVAQRCVSNFISEWGSSDLNWTFEQELTAGPPFKDLKKYWDMSPMKYIVNAETPTMIVHNEGDLRCPIEQGEQAFVALKRIGVETEFIRFPEEFHGLSRSGRTDRRIARLNHILRWMDKYLK